MNKLEGKRILILQQRNWGKGIGRFLAGKLYSEGCKLAALTFKKSVHELIVEQPNAKYELIIGNDDVMSRPKEYLAGETYSLAQICKDLGVDSIWPIAAALRNHVRSYKDKYYYSYKQNVSDEGIIDFIMAVYKYIKVFFNEFKPDMIIAPNFVSLPHIMMYLYAKQKNVPMTCITESKIPGYYIFVYDYMETIGGFHKRVDELNNRRVETTNRLKAKRYIEEFRVNFKKPIYLDNTQETDWIKKIKLELRPFVQIWRWYARKKVARINYLESTGVTIDYRPPKIILRDYFCQKRYRKFAKNYKYYPLEKIKKLVYFPLQFQPEYNIDVPAAFFSNQVETARQVAMSLPDDYTLAVKEHPGMIGLRPPSYLEKIDRTVNIKLIDYRISSETMLKKADLIISPSGTTIAEAAFYKKPVIQLGDLGTTLKLPNVTPHTDMTTLAKKIKEVLAVDLNNDEYERRLENYVAAAYDTGFNFDYSKAWEKASDNLEMLWNIYKKEISRTLLNS